MVFCVVNSLNHSVGSETTPWYEEARRALLGEEQVEAEANAARWAGIRAAVEGKLAQHLKPIEEYEGDLKEFIEVSRTCAF